MTKFFYHLSLLVTLALAEDPSVETKTDKVLDKILDGKYNSSQLKELGSSTNICKKLDDDHIESIMDKMNKAHMKLGTKCLLDLLNESSGTFEKLVEDIKDDKKAKQKFFRIHAAGFCESKGAFKKHLDKKEWYEPLEKFCLSYDLEDIKARLEEEKKVRQELEAQQKAGNGAAAAMGAGLG